MYQKAIRGDRILHCGSYRLTAKQCVLYSLIYSILHRAMDYGTVGGTPAQCTLALPHESEVGSATFSTIAPDWLQSSNKNDWCANESFSRLRSTGWTLKRLSEGSAARYVFSIPRSPGERRGRCYRVWACSGSGLTGVRSCNLRLVTQFGFKSDGRF